MTKRHIKLIMELIFIFILPLVFICFTSEIQVERQFTYDNQGNYETSADTKQLSFDNSIIKYTKQKNIIEYSMELNLFEVTYYPIDKIMYFKEEDILNEETVLYATFAQNTEELTIGLNADYTLYIYYSYNDNYHEIQYYNIINQNNINYYAYKLDVEIEMSQDTTIETNLGYYTNTHEIEVVIQVNTIWGNIKELLINNLDLNDNVLLDIVLCYTILWVVMWIIWHLFYGFLELLIHIVPRKWEADY